MVIFNSGQRLTALIFPDECEIRVGTANCTKIEVVDVRGEMGYVPWARVSYDGGRATTIWNMSLLAGVEE